VNDVTVRYPIKGGGTHTVFSGLNFTIDEGEFVCVVGQTGCGKSTLLRLILGSEPNDSTKPSLIASQTRNVRLDGRTQLMLRVMDK